VLKRLLLFTLAILGLMIAMPLQSVSANRYLQAHDSRNLWLKEGSYGGLWRVLTNNAQGINGVTGTATRIAYTDDNGVFWLKDGPANVPWVRVATNVREASVAGDKIYIVTRDNKLFGKAGDYRGPWTLLRTNTHNVKASPNRVIAIADYDGTVASLAIKEGGLSAPWRLLAKPNSTSGGNYTAPDFSVTDTRIAYIPSDFSGAYVKQGSFKTPWQSNLWTTTSTRIAFGIKASSSRLCINAVIDASIMAFCKDGPLEAPWVRARTNAVISDITDTQIATQDTGSNNINILEGSLARNSGWKTIDNKGWLVFSK
jgi:hypothetical protein